MNISINVVLYQLEKYISHQVYLQNVNPERAVRGIKLFDPGTTQEAEELLLIDREILAELTEEKYTDRIFLCISKEIEKLPAFPSKLQIIFLECQTSKESVFNQIIQIFSVFEEWNRMIHEAILKQEPLQAVIDACEMIADFPLMIFDAGFNVIACTENLASKDKGFLKSMEQGYSGQEIMEQLSMEKIHEKVKKNDQIVWRKPIEAEKEQWLNAQWKFNVGEKIIGYGLATNCPTGKKEACDSLLNLIRDNIRLFLQGNDYYKGYDSLYEKFLEGMIQSGTNADEKKLKEQLKYIDQLEYEGKFQLFRIAFSSLEEPLHYISNRIRNNFLLLPFISKGDLYLLRNEKVYSGKEECGKEFNRFLEFLSGYDYIGTESVSFSKLDQIAFAAKQCDAAMNYALQDNTEANQFYPYETYVLSHLRDLLPEDYLQMIRTSSSYKIVKEYDEKNNTDMCDILAQYFLNECNSNQTAQKLYAHKNTVFYKIKKIQKITGEEFEEYGQRLYFLLAWLADKYPRRIQ